MSGFEGLGKRKAAGGGDENETKKSKKIDEKSADKVEPKKIDEKININDVIPTYAAWYNKYKTITTEDEPFKKCVLAFDCLLRCNIQKNEKQKNLDILNDLKKQAKEKPTQYELLFFAEMCSCRINESNAVLILNDNGCCFIGEIKERNENYLSGEGCLLQSQCRGYYKGSIMNDSQHGEGISLLKSDNDTIIKKEGTFAYDYMIKGVATVTDIEKGDLKLEYEGEFKKGYFEKGKMFHYTNNRVSLMMEGCFNNNEVLNGRGKATFFYDSYKGKNHSAEGHFINGVCKKPVWNDILTKKKVDSLGYCIILSEEQFEDYNENERKKFEDKQIEEALKQLNEMKSPEPTKSKEETTEDIRRRTPKGKQCEEACLNSPAKKSHVRCKTPPNTSRDYNNTKHEKTMAKFYETHPERKEHHRVTRLNAKKEEKRLFAEQKSKQKSKSKKP
tara:strand:+ start:1298 stop:2635 length:1338 start_codon:yes stop_codon:yes gene_type:complete